MKDNEILQVARERFKRSVDAESKNRDMAVEDIRFKQGDQWPEDIESIRKRENRVCLTINKVPTYVRQITNDMRQMRPAIKVNPVDSASDPKTAEVINGMIRAIEGDSDAESCYDWAGERAVVAGWGYWKYVKEYADEQSFDQILKVKRIRNTFTIYDDPDCREYDRSDRKYLFETVRIPRDEFEAQYPGVTSEWSDQGEGEDRDQWYSNDSVRVAKYWTVEEEKDYISAVVDPLTGGPVIVPGKVEGFPMREVTHKRVVCRTITGQDVLETVEWEGKYIPYVVVLGVEEDIEGEQFLKGMVRDMVDPCMQYNLIRSASVETIALQPKVPYIGAEGQFRSNKWATANRQNHPYLEYRPVGNEPPPRREPPPQLSPAMVAEQQTADGDIKAVTGIYDPGLGQRSNEVAGVAIDSRKAESDLSNFHFPDNLARSMRFGGKILVDLIPKIYSGPRMISILKPDGETEKVQINQEYMDEQKQEVVNYDLTVGRYDATVDTGPSYGTQRKEAAASMTDLIKSFPDAAPLIGDLVAAAMDWPQADEVSKRLKALLPPEVLQGENPQFAAVMKQMQTQYEGQIQQLQGYVQSMQDQIQAMEIELRNKAGELAIKQQEQQRKEAETQQNYDVDVTKLELEYNKQLTGGINGQ